VHLRSGGSRSRSPNPGGWGASAGEALPLLLTLERIAALRFAQIAAGDGRLEEPREHRRRLGLHAGENMLVDAHGESGAGVTEAFTDDLYQHSPHHNRTGLPTYRRYKRLGSLEGRRRSITVFWIQQSTGSMQMTTLPFLCSCSTYRCASTIRSSG